MWYLCTTINYIHVIFDGNQIQTVCSYSKSLKISLILYITDNSTNFKYQMLITLFVTFLLKQVTYCLYMLLEFLVPLHNNVSHLFISSLCCIGHQAIVFIIFLSCYHFYFTFKSKCYLTERYRQIKDTYMFRNHPKVLQLFEQNRV